MAKSRKLKTKRVVEELLEEYPDMFITDYEENKILIQKVMIISSKKIRNKIAGFLTAKLNALKKEA